MYDCNLNVVSTLKECSLQMYKILLKLFICTVIVEMCLSLGVLSHKRFFSLSKDVSIFSEGLQIKTYTRHSWSFSSEDYLPCNVYCDTKHQFILIYPTTCDTHTCNRSLCSWTITVLTIQVCHNRGFKV